MRETESDQQATIAFLSGPGSYGAEGPVERIDTHAAIVFLVGDRAYKLKRAVRYPYLDFTTVAKRKAVCEIELRLNRRTAPELYLAVRSVNRDPSGSLTFGEGEPVDWLVVMRRFDADCLLETMAARGDLDAVLCRNLADEIAGFHDIAQVVRDAGGAARVGKVIEGNRASMVALPYAALPPEECERLHARSTEECTTLASLLERRAVSGHVRHCHGDLHLANICLWQGRPMLFDCLEFDADLATVDVLYDLAFLVMDLWHRDYRRQASLIFNRYLDMRDESAGIGAFPLFLSMRAAVRAHVSATAAQAQDKEAGRAAKLVSARKYLALATAFLEPGEARLVVIGGLSGTGKSTLANELASDIGRAPGARWLRTDVLRKRMAGVVPEMRLGAEHYTPERSAEVYDRLLSEAEELLALGQSAIVDGVFSRPAERAKIAAVARAAAVPFTGLWLDAPPERLIDRVVGRANDASDADRQVVERQLGCDLGDLTGWRRIDAGGSAAETLARARELIRRTDPT